MIGDLIKERWAGVGMQPIARRENPQVYQLTETAGDGSVDTVLKGGESQSTTTITSSGFDDSPSSIHTMSVGGGSLDDFDSFICPISVGSLLRCLSKKGKNTFAESLSSIKCSCWCCAFHTPGNSIFIDPQRITSPTYFLGKEGRLTTLQIAKEADSEPALFHFWCTERTPDPQRLRRTEGYFQSCPKQVSIPAEAEFDCSRRLYFSLQAARRLSARTCGLRERFQRGKHSSNYTRKCTTDNLNWVSSPTAELLAYSESGSGVASFYRRLSGPCLSELIRGGDVSRCTDWRSCLSSPAEEKKDLPIRSSSRLEYFSTPWGYEGFSTVRFVKLSGCILALKRLRELSQLGLRHNNLSLESFIFDTSCDSTLPPLNLLDLKLGSLEYSSDLLDPEFFSNSANSLIWSPEACLSMCCYEQSTHYRLGRSSDCWAIGLSLCSLLAGRSLPDLLNGSGANCSLNLNKCACCQLPSLLHLIRRMLESGEKVEDCDLIAAIESWICLLRKRFFEDLQWNDKLLRKTAEDLFDSLVVEPPFKRNLEMAIARVARRKAALDAACDVAPRPG